MIIALSKVVKFHSLCPMGGMAEWRKGLKRLKGHRAEGIEHSDCPVTDFAIRPMAVGSCQP